jgi:hypothetical protein
LVEQRNSLWSRFPNAKVEVTLVLLKKLVPNFQPRNQFIEVRELNVKPSIFLSSILLKA